MRVPRLAVNIGLALVTVIALFVAAELALRLVLLRNLNPFEPDPEVGYRLKASFDGVYPRAWVRTDSLGRRIPRQQAGDATGEMLFVGDSVTFGFGVSAEESFPFVAGRQLGQPRTVTVAAVPGYNLEQVLALLEESFEQASPRWVVYGLVVNDIGSARTPATYADIDPHAARSAAGGPLSWSMFAAFVERRIRRIELRFQPPEELREQADEDYDRMQHLDAEAVAAFDAQWGRLEAMAEAAGVPFYVLICPYRQQVHGSAGAAFQRFAAARCAAGSLECLDPLPAFLAAADEPLFNGTSAFHYSPRGHELLGRWLAERLGR